MTLQWQTVQTSPCHSRQLDAVLIRDSSLAWPPLRPPSMGSGPSARARTPELGRAMVHPLSPVNTGRKADHCLSMAELIACTAARLFAAASCLCLSTLPFDKLREIARKR